jgi:FG-GAP-like repeat
VSGIAVLLNQGGNTFAESDYPMENAGGRPGLGDVDGDIDILVADVGGASVVHALTNQGDGSFAYAGSFPANVGGGYLATADLDGDGRADVLVPESGVLLQSVCLP